MKLFAVLTLSAVVAGLAHPPLSWWGTLFIAPSLLFGFLPGKPKRAGFGWGWWWGFVYGLTVGYSLTYLIHLRTGSWALSLLGLILVVGLSALFMGLFGTLATQMARSLLGAIGIAGIWTLSQWARGLGPFAFVWGHFSVALTPMPLLLQPADLGGAWFLEFLIALWNALLGIYWVAPKILSASPQARSGAWALGLLALAWLGYGVVRFSQYAQAPLPPDSPTVAIIQPNVNLARTYKPDEWERYRAQIESLVRQAGEQKPTLIVLPESLELYPMPQSAFAFDRWRALAYETGSAILLGGYRVGDPKTDRWTNTAHLFLPNGEWLYHDKVQLVPLGETVPFREWLPFLSAFGVVEQDTLPGESLKPLQAGTLRIGAVICMESTYPWIARQLVREGANLLWVGSNESWFGRTPALEQHLAFSVLRAVETRRWLVRSAPEGVSAFIRPNGTVQALPPFEPSVQVETVALHTEQTLATRWGDWVIWLCLLGAGVGGITGRGKQAL